MKLKSVQVTNFKSIEDSGVFSIDEITCLVGKNESGKSNLLQALYKLNPYEADKGKFDKDEDYPRRHLSEYAERHPEEDAVVITTKWELSEDDAKVVTDTFGPGALKSREVTISKGYDNELSWSFDLDEAAIVAYLVESATELHKLDREKALKSESFIGLKKDLKDLAAEANERQTAFLAALEKIGKGSTDYVLAARFITKLPKFILFSAYDKMLGRVSLQDLKRRVAEKKLERDHEVFMSFMQLAGVSIEDVELKQFEPFRARLEAASNRITKILFKYWRQNKHLRV